MPWQCDKPRYLGSSGKKRVLESSLGYKEQTLLLLYSEPETAVPAEELFE